MPSAPLSFERSLRRITVVGAQGTHLCRSWQIAAQDATQTQPDGPAGGRCEQRAGPAGRPDRPRGSQSPSPEAAISPENGSRTRVIVASLAEIEHRQQGAGDRVEGAAADATEVPVVFNEAQDRALVGEAVIDKVLARERRDDQQRQAGPVAAAALLIAERRRAAGADRGVLPGRGVIHDGRGDVIVPPVGVVVGDEDRRVAPLRQRLQSVQRLDDEGLLCQGRGVRR